MPPLPETRPPPTSPPGASMSKTRPTPSCLSGGLEKEDVLRKKNEAWVDHLPESTNCLYLKLLERGVVKMTNPSYENVFDHFNAELFNGKLPSMEFSKSMNQIHWENGMLLTLIYEMIIHWQVNFGTPTTPNLLNKELMSKFKELGVIYLGDIIWPGVTEDGRFEHVVTKMPGKLKEDFKKVTMTVKYTCPACGYSKWCRPGLGKQCNACDAIMKVRR